METKLCFVLLWTVVDELILTYGHSETHSFCFVSRFPLCWLGSPLSLTTTAEGGPAGIDSGGPAGGRRSAAVRTLGFCDRLRTSSRPVSNKWTRHGGRSHFQRKQMALWWAATVVLAGWDFIPSWKKPSGGLKPTLVVVLFGDRSALLCVHLYSICL